MTARRLALIPARSWSKGVPDKNVPTVAGRPLLPRAVDAAREAQLLDRIFVSTYSEAYAGLVREVTLAAESPECNAAFTVSPVAVRLHALKQYEIDAHGEAAFCHPAARPNVNRQELSATYVRNGCCYAVRVASLLETRGIGGMRARAFVTEGPAISIDTPQALAERVRGVGHACASGRQCAGRSFGGAAARDLHAEPGRRARPWRRDTCWRGRLSTRASRERGYPSPAMLSSSGGRSRAPSRSTPPSRKTAASLETRERPRRPFRPRKRR